MRIVHIAQFRRQLGYAQLHARHHAVGGAQMVAVSLVDKHPQGFFAVVFLGYPCQTAVLTDRLCGLKLREPAL